MIQYLHIKQSQCKVESSLKITLKFSDVDRKESIAILQNNGLNKVVLFKENIQELIDKLQEIKQIYNQE